MEDIYFRAVSTTDSEYPSEEDFYIEFLEYRVVRRTNKGAWIKKGIFDKPRFVLNEATKRYAYPSKDQALESLISRKIRHIKILESQLSEARVALRLANELKNQPPERRVT